LCLCGLKDIFTTKARRDTKENNQQLTTNNQPPTTNVMKFFPILASITGLLILPGGMGLSSPQPVVAQVTDKIAPLTNSNHPVYQAARAITVRVLVKDNRGSGVLIAQENGVYTVLTNAHVLTAGAPYRVETPDGQVYEAQEALVSSVIGLDAALLQFRSSKSYAVARLANTNISVGQPVWAAGFPEETGNFLVTEGQLSLFSARALIDGYQLGYSNEVIPGMSGGPLLNQQGEVVGINGLSAYPILDNAYTFMDGSQPNAAQREELRRLSWASPVQLAFGIAGQQP
jgi:S1-C subfamily serine protease